MQAAVQRRRLVRNCPADPSHKFGIQRTIFSDLPRVLVVQLQRFADYAGTKKETLVQFPLSNWHFPAEVNNQVATLPCSASFDLYKFLLGDSQALSALAPLL